MVDAYTSGQTVTVAAAADIWALGVMAFEALVGFRAVETTAHVFLCASGGQPYPWDEAELPAAPERWRKSRLRPVIEQCLTRDAAARPTAAQVAAQLERLWVLSVA